MDDLSVEFRGLRSFAVAARERSFRRAAAGLHITQPALSLQMANLERAIGCPLFVRSHRGVALTDAGRVLVQRVEELTRAVEEAVADVRLTADGLGGLVRLAATPSASAGLVSVAFRAFHAARPGIVLSLRESYSEEALDMLSDGLVDVAIVRGPVRRPGIVGTILIDEPIVAIVPTTHRLARRRRVPLSQLATENFVMIGARPETAVHATVISACVEAGFMPRIACQGAEVMTIGVMVADGVGIALVPRLFADLLARMNIATVAVTPAPRSTLVLASRVDTSNPAADALASALVDAARNLEPLMRGST